jgi:ATP-binding cassette subfamily B multidrug efflux pump
MFGDSARMREIMSREQLKPRNLSDTLGRFGDYFKPYWYMGLLSLLLVIISTWAQVVTPELVGQAVDCFLTPGLAAASFPGAEQQTTPVENNCWLTSDHAKQDWQTRLFRNLTYSGTTAPTQAEMANFDTTARLTGLGRLTLVLIGVFVLGSVLVGMSFFSMSWAGQHVLRTMRERIFAHLHRLSLGYYSEHEAGDLMSRLTNDATAIEQAFGFALVNVFSGALLLLWVAYNMLKLNWQFALLSLLVMPFMLLATLWFSGQARKAYRSSRRELGSVNAELQENIAAVREVQAFNRAEENIEQFKQVNAANRDANVRAVAYTSALAPVLEALGYLALAIVTGVGGWYLLKGQTLGGVSVSLGLLIAFLGYVQRFNQPIQQIAVLWTNVQSAIAGGERVFSLLDEIPSVQNRPNAKQMPQIQGLVQFDGATAEYKAGQPVLKNVSFEAKPGQTIAIVGPTGAGKTTIINLLPRFYDVTNGSVKIDGIDVRDVTLQSLRQQIGIVLQDTFLFSASVMENIRFGNPSASDAEVLAAAKLAYADTFIERLPDKYNTVLGERGSGLSQGQRQLLAIARAALANPRILILDEATSSVDTRTERLIQQALDTLLKGRTSFVIAHRLSTIRNADVVLVLKKGEIVEHGTHNELLAQRGAYYDLYMSQFRHDAEIEGTAQPTLQSQPT